MQARKDFRPVVLSPKIKSAKGRNRTDDTSIFSAVLYRLSYLGMCVPVWYVPHYSMSLLRRQYLLLSNYHTPSLVLFSYVSACSKLYHKMDALI